MGGIDVAVLVQAGAVGIAIAALLLLRETISRQAVQMEKVMQVVKENAEAMTGLKSALESVCRATDETRGLITAQLQAQMVSFQNQLQEMRGGGR